MPKYLLTIYADESGIGTASEEELAQVIKAYTEVTQAMKDSGAFLSGEAVQPTPTATSVRVRDGKTETTDGPFAETKEAMNGFYLLEVKDQAEAETWAARIPGATRGTIEVRPVMEFPDS